MSVILAQILAGLGIFLYGMSSLESGIESLGSRRLKNLMARSTGSPVSSAAFGAVVTAILQSSSMVSLLVLAFAGAGIMPLFNAIGIIIGSNLGTTFTGWIVATIGFKLDLASMALPLLGGGGLCQVIASKERHIYYWGRSATGLGLLLLGLSVMKDSVGDLPLQWDISALQGLHPLIYLLAGVLLTAVIQSSSATVMLTLTALHGGLINLPEAGALVIGADLGTISTTLIASLAGAGIKRQLALAQLVFNVVVDVAAFLLLLPLLPWAVAQLGLTDPLYSLVAFHSTLNLLGLLAFLPVLGRFSLWVSQFFNEPEDRLLLLSGIKQAVPEAGLPALQTALRRLWLVAVMNNLRSFGLRYEDLPLASVDTTDLEEVARELDEERSPIRIYEWLREQESAIFQLCYKLQQAPLSASQSQQVSFMQELTRSIVYAGKTMQDIAGDLERLRRSSSAANADDLFQAQRRFHSQFYGELCALVTTAQEPHFLKDAVSRLTDRNNAHYRDMDAAVYRRARDGTDLEPILSIQLNVNRELHNALGNLVSSAGLFSAIAEADEPAPRATH